MAKSPLKHQISFQYICRKHTNHGALAFFVHLPHISCFGIYPKSEVAIITQNTFHFCFFLDWALGGAALGLTVALVEFIANSVVEVPTTIINNLYSQYENDADGLKSS